MQDPEKKLLAVGRSTKFRSMEGSSSLQDCKDRRYVEKMEKTSLIVVVFLKYQGQ
jgi:hypothetical protein